MKQARFFILTAFLFLACMPAWAQNKEISESEKAVFAFFKLAKTEPDFEHWVKSSEKFRQAADTYQQQQILRVEMLRLQYGFGTYDVAKNSIRLRTSAKFLLQGPAENATLLFAFASRG